MVGADLTAVKIWNDDTVVVVVAVASSRLAAWIIVAAAAAFGSVFQWLDMDSDERKAGVVAWVAVVVFAVAVAVAVAFVVDGCFFMRSPHNFGAWKSKHHHHHE